MIKIVKELNIEVARPNVIQAIVAKQYDANSRFLKITFIDGGKPINIPTTAKVVINAERKDGQSNSFEGVVNDDGTVTVPLHSWMLELEGTVICDISAIDTAENEGGKLSTTSFTLVVEKSSHGGSDISNDPQYDILLSLIEQVESFSDGATFTPSVSSAGVLSWTNDKGLTNPASVNIKGATGSAGKDGSSVTVTKVTESTADGGSNVVTFSDGKTLTVKNGSKGTPGTNGVDGKTPTKGVDYFDGADGHTPVKGVDYYTEADKNEFTQYISNELAKRGQLKPEFANNVEECTDTTKLYVLPDSYIYAYMLTEVESKPTYTNKLPLAVNSTGGEYVGTNGEDGYKSGYRISSTGEEKELAGCFATGFIPVVKGDIVRIKGIADKENRDYVVAYFFTSSFTKTTGTIPLMGTTTFVTPDENGVYTFTIPNYDSIAYFRITLTGVTSNTIITVNEEITPSGGTTIAYAWANTGHAFVPSEYEDRILEVENIMVDHTAKIEALGKAVKSGNIDESQIKALNRIKDWKYPIIEDSPVFLLETNKPAITSTDQTTEAIYAKYDTLMAGNSHYITKVDCGLASDKTTHIYAYHFKESVPHYARPDWSETKPVVLVCSGIHPYEQAGIWSLYYAMEEITTNKKLFDLRRTVHFIVVPMINPTAFNDEMGQRNPDGIQMHYNFEVDFKYPTDEGYVPNGQKNHGGEAPLSIPETQYFDAIMEEYKDTLACVLSCHNNDIDQQYGTGFIWGSCATHFTCNLIFRLVDKMSMAWREKYGEMFDEGIRWANNYAITNPDNLSILNNEYKKEQPEWDYRVGRSALSGSGGTEYKQALKYGVHGLNVEVCRRCLILDRAWNKSFTENVTTMGTETYINFFRTFMAVYDPKNKKDYAPNLPWSE